MNTKLSIAIFSGFLLLEANCATLAKGIANKETPKVDNRAKETAISGNMEKLIKQPTSSDPRLSAIRKLWDLMHPSESVDKTNRIWNGLEPPVKHMPDGYGVFTAYHTQSSGIWKNDKFLYGVQVNDNEIIGKDVSTGIKIVLQDGLGKIYGLNDTGLALKEILYFQNLSFNGFSKLNALTEIDDHEVESTRLVRTEEGNGLVGYSPVYDFKTESRYVKGLKNKTNRLIYIRAYSKRRISDRVLSDVPIEYFDESFILKPGLSMAWADFDENPFDNEQPVSTNVLRNMTDAEAKHKGFIEYLKYVGQYSDNESNEAPEKIVPNKGKIYTYDVDAKTKLIPLNIHKGDKITFEASGSIVLGTLSGSGGPEGISDHEFYRILSQFLDGALLVKIGDGQWQAIGTNMSTTAKESGSIQFLINDSSLPANAGNFQVKIQVLSSFDN